MGLLDSIFGGGDQKSTTTFQLAPEQREVLDLAMPFLRDVGANPPPPPSGTAIAPFNETQKFAQEGALGTMPMLNDFAANAWDSSHYLTNAAGSTPFTTQYNKIAAGRGGPNPATQHLRPIASGQSSNPVLDMLSMFTSGDLMNVDTNPALRNAIDAATRPIVDSTLQRALPAVRQDFIGAGQYGGTKQGLAESQAINDMQRQVGDTSSLMANRAYETGMQGTLQGLGMYSDAYGQDIGNQLAALGMRSDDFNRRRQQVIDAGGIRADAHNNELNAMLRALGLAPQTQQMGLLPWQVAAGVGDTQHGMEMAQQKEAYDQDNLARMWNLTLGQELAGTAGGIPGGSNVSKQDAPSMNPFSAILGGLSLAGGLGPLFGFL